MILPMMGLCFCLCVFGLCAGAVAFIWRRFRHFAPFVLLMPLLAGIGAFILSWGLAFLLEKSTSAAPFGGFGFFGGYAVGGLGGGIIGLISARRIKT
jgi:hypothetical protein